MRTIREVLASLIDSTPFLESALAEGIVNLTAFARSIRPQVEADLLRPVSVGAMVMALKRMMPSLEATASAISVPWSVGDLTVRSHLSGVTVQWSATVLAAQQHLLEAIRERAQQFVAFAQGVREVSIIMDADIEHLAHEVFSGERLVSRLSDLAAITLSHHRTAAANPAVYYEALKRLAMKAITVVQVISTPTEFTVVVNHEDLDQAFSVLRGGMAERRSPA